MFILVYNMFITHKDKRLEVEQVKSAHTSSGFHIYLFRICPNMPVALVNSYIVAVKDPNRVTVQFKYIPRFSEYKSLKIAMEYYMDYLLMYC